MFVIFLSAVEIKVVCVNAHILFYCQQRPEELIKADKMLPPPVLFAENKCQTQR